MAALLEQTATLFPNVTIKVATSAANHLKKPSFSNISVKIIDVDNNKDHFKMKKVKDGNIWQSLMDEVQTPYAFAALDLISIDSLDFNFMRMVSENDTESDWISAAQMSTMYFFKK